MASTIVTKNSSTASAVPVTGDLTQGELAVNVTDKKLYTKDSGGTVVKIVGGLGNQEANAVAITGGSVNGTTIGATTASTGAFTTLSASSTTTLSGGTANGVAYLNGSKVVTTGSALTFDGTNLGIGVTSPSAPLEVQSNSGGTGIRIRGRATANTGTLRFYANDGTTQQAKIEVSDNTFEVGSITNVPFVFNQNGSEQMRLTSTGLGIGTSSPSVKLHVKSSSTEIAYFESTSASNFAYTFYKSATGNGAYVGINGNGDFIVQTPGSSYSTKLTLDSSGNLGLGVTPSAWATYKALQVGQVGALWANPSGTDVYWSANYYFGSGSDRYIANGLASYYRQSAGVHSWGIAPSGTAGNAITFTQAMTLGADGTLGVGTTTAVASDGTLVAAGSVGTGQGAANTVAQINIWETTSGNKAGLWFGAMTNSNVGVIGSRTASGAIAFQTYNGGWAERARIDSSGNLLVGTTNSDNTVNTGSRLYSNGSFGTTRSGTDNTTSTLVVYSTGASTNRFYVGMAGTVYATSTTITAISDQRLKENIQDIDVGLDAVMALKPRKFDWKAGKGKNKKGDRGWIAQEFEQVFPDMIDTWADPAPEGEEPYKAVNADLIPVLVKAIQEQQALITQLTERITALEGK